MHQAPRYYWLVCWSPLFQDVKVRTSALQLWLISASTPFYRELLLPSPLTLLYHGIFHQKTRLILQKSLSHSPVSDNKAQCRDGPGARVRRDGSLQTEATCFFARGSCTPNLVFTMLSWVQSSFSARPPAVRYGLTAAVIGISAVAAAFVRPKLAATRKHSYTAEAVCTFRYALPSLCRALFCTDPSSSAPWLPHSVDLTLSLCLDTANGLISPTHFFGLAKPRSAISRTEAEPRYHTRDHLAEYFIPWGNWLLLKFFPALLHRRADEKYPGCIPLLIARTNTYDMLMEKTLAADKEISQVVILGAGFDTRFYRLSFPKDRELRLFEVDAIPTQTRKRQVLATLSTNLFTSGRAPSSIDYVAVNFDVDSIESALLRTSRYNKRAKTLFIWEGVTMYLQPESIDEVLSFIKRGSAPGSVLACDIVYRECITGGKKYNMTKVASEAVKVAEPWKFGVNEGGVRDWIATHGFVPIATYGPKEFLEHVTSKTSYSLLAPDIQEIVVAHTPLQPQ